MQYTFERIDDKLVSEVFSDGSCVGIVVCDNAGIDLELPGTPEDWRSGMVCWVGDSKVFPDANSVMDAIVQIVGVHGDGDGDKANTN